jgi:WD40 repeat protein
MEIEKIDVYPEYCLSFSPNWYAHQILSISKDGLVAYGSNDEVYVINIADKKILTSVTMRDPAVQKIKESAMKKISAVLITREHLIMTNAFGYLAVFTKTDEVYELRHLEKLEGAKEIAYIRTFHMEGDSGLHFVLGDVEQTAIVCSFRAGELEKTLRVRKGKPTRNKYFYLYSYQSVQFIALVQEDSTIQLWDTNMKEQLFHIDLKKRVNTADMIMCENYLLVALYSKSTGFVFATINLRNLFDDMVSNKSKLEIFKEFKKTDIIIEDESSIPKDTKFIMQRVMWLDKHTLLLSGQLGEIYQINLPLVKDGQTIVLKPFSLDSLNEQPYELLEENPHYKAIYFIDRFEDMVISIGVDRKITFWDYNEDTILYNFSIDCLGGKVDLIINNRQEKQFSVLICKDFTIRIWDISKKVQAANHRRTTSKR